MSDRVELLSHVCHPPVRLKQSTAAPVLDSQQVSGPGGLSAAVLMLDGFRNA